MISLPITKCWPQYSCCNMLPLTCMSCLIIGLGTELTASTVKRWFTLSSSFQRWTWSAANFLPSTQKKRRKKKKDVFCFLVTEKRKHKVNFFLSVKIYSALWDKTVPWRDQGKERTHPPLYKMTAGQSKPGQCKDPEQNKSFCSPCAPLHLLYRPYPHTHPLQPPHTQNESWGKRALSRTNS